MDENRYNTRVRQAMSDKYVDYTWQSNEKHKECQQLENRLFNEQDILTYKEYKMLQRELEECKREYEKLKIQADTWGMARELTMDVADEVCEEVKK